MKCTSRETDNRDARIKSNNKSIEFKYLMKNHEVSPRDDTNSSRYWYDLRTNNREFSSAPSFKFGWNKLQPRKPETPNNLDELHPNS